VVLAFRSWPGARRLRMDEGELRDRDARDSGA
jgi:hypothetical protein